MQNLAEVKYESTFSIKCDHTIYPLPSFVPGLYLGSGNFTGYES